MIWGGVSLKGLIPSTSPIFVCDLKKEWEKLGNPKTRGVTGDIYSFMITKYAVPAVTKLYGQRAVWQDDPPHSCGFGGLLSFCFKDPT